jgi:transcriptional/translational regulatory protein YebC/TACO1
VLTDPSDLPDVRAALETAGIPFDSADVTMLAENTVPITEPDKARTVLGLIDLLDDNDDVQNVFANFDASNEVLEAVGG